MAIILTFTRITAALALLATWNLILLVIGVAIVIRPGGQNAATAFLFIPIPLLNTALSAFDLIRHSTLTPRRAIFSATFGCLTYFVGFALWGQCSYFGFHPFCWNLDREYYEYHDNDDLRLVLPWFALGPAVVHLAAAIFAGVLFYRERNAPAGARGLEAEQKLSFTSSEFEISTIGDQTLPSRPRSSVPSRSRLFVPSRQVSQRESTRPPTYYTVSSGEDSLLEVEEKEKRKSDGLV